MTTSSKINAEINAEQNTELSTIYDRDVHNWLETTIAQIKQGNLQELDLEHLIEELEGLAGRDRREIEQRLKVLIEHLLKRCYVNLPECDRGWEITIIDQRSELIGLLEQSPSLNYHFLQVFDRAFQTALKIVQLEYPETNFPTTWQFSQEITVMLNEQFWLS
jgi:Domain of unknown function DUF29